METLKKIFTGATLALACVSGEAQLAIPNTATNVIFPQTIPPLLSTQTTNRLNGGITNAAVIIQPGFGLGFQWTVSAPESTASNYTWVINTSVDATNWPNTNYPIKFSRPLGYPGQSVTYNTNIPWWLFDGMRAARVEEVSTAATNTLTFTNVILSRTRLQTRVP